MQLFHRVVGGVFLCLAVAVAAVPAWSASPQVFMSWRAPYGSPRATDTLRVACGDTTRTDTLYLTFDPARDAPTLYGLTVSLSIHPAAGDSLGPYWRAENWSNFRVEFLSAAIAGCEHPWTSSGFGAPHYKSSRGGGLIQMVYAVPSPSASGVKSGTRYCFARVIFRRPAKAENCGQPICIEWSGGGFSFTLADAEALVAADSPRFVSINSPGGRLCSAVRKATPGWTPKPATAAHDTTHHH